MLHFAELKFLLHDSVLILLLLQKLILITLPDLILKVIKFTVLPMKVKMVYFSLTHHFNVVQQCSPTHQFHPIYVLPYDSKFLLIIFKNSTSSGLDLLQEVTIIPQHVQWGSPRVKPPRQDSITYNQLRN